MSARRTTPDTPIGAAVHAAQAALQQVDTASPAQALPLLREAQACVTEAIDEAMAAVVLVEAGSIRSAGLLAGLSENAVGPRLARTSLLAAYGADTGRVTAAGVERARYDLEQGRHRTPDTADDGNERSERPPLRFRARRPS